MLKFTLAAACILATHAQAQQFLMMPDSTNNRIVLFNATDGSVVNTNYFALAGGTPIHAMQVGNEIWVSEQIGDRISRYGLDGSAHSPITGGMDNIRGMAQINGTIYLCNAGTANGAPGVNAVIMFDTAGNNLGSYQTTGLATGPFGLLPHEGDLLVASVSGNDDIHRFTPAGVSVGTFYNSTISFAEQMDHALNGDVLVACFTTGGITRLSPTGTLVSSFTASSSRGVHQLPNGNIMWTSGTGVFIYNPTTGGSTSIYGGGGRFIDTLNLTPPCGTSDFDGDGDFGTDSDIEAFFACLGGNCCATCFPGGSDFDADGDAGTDADIEAFFRVLGGGHC